MVGDGSGGRVSGSGAEPLPPAVTQWNYRAAGLPEPVLAPPFTPGISTPAPVDISPDTDGSLLELTEGVLELTEPVDADAIAAAADSAAEVTDPFAGDPDALPEQMPWEARGIEPMPWEAPAVEPMPWEEVPASLQWAEPRADEDVEGIVEPAFEEDVSVTTDAILAAAPEEEFPIDAFIIPEHARRVPTGVPDPEHAHHGDPAHELADRFEKLSRRLRAEDIESLLPSLARGDRFDALVAGFIAGYFSARDI